MPMSDHRTATRVTGPFAAYPTGANFAALPLVCQDQAVRGHEAKVEATLREAAALPPREHIVATWSGYLMEVRPSHPFIDASARPTAVLGVTDSAIYLISEVGLLRATFDADRIGPPIPRSLAIFGRLRGPHCPGRDVLRFSVSDGHDQPVVVTMAVKGAHAIAHQLNDAIRRPRPPLVPPRPRAKRRPTVEYVD
jgi:hypothetical protein